MSTDAIETRTQLMTKSEAAQYLKISEWSLYNLKRIRQVACCKIAGKLMFKRDDLDAYIERNRIPAADCE